MKSIIGWFLIAVGMVLVYGSFLKDYGFIGNSLSFIVFIVGFDLVVNDLISNREAIIRADFHEALIELQDSQISHPIDWSVFEEPEIEKVTLSPQDHSPTVEVKADGFRRNRDGLIIG